jgi:hypothetical protein
LEESTQSGADDAAIAYFFFDFSDPEKQKSTNMLRSLVYQLCSRVSAHDIPLSIRQENPPNDVLIKALIMLSKKFRITYIVLDALDESDRAEVLDVMGDLLDANSGGRFNLLMTSRKEQDLVDGLSRLPTAPKTIDIQDPDVDRDILDYVRARLNTEPRFKNLPEMIRKEIEAAIGKGAQGM